MAYKYKIKRACYTGPVPGQEQVYDPEKSYINDGSDRPGPAGIVYFDVVEGGWVPPHHFEPLDGGPVGEAPEGFHEIPGDIADRPSPAEARTLSEMQRGGGSTSTRPSNLGQAPVPRVMPKQPPPTSPPKAPPAPPHKQPDKK